MRAFGWRSCLPFIVFGELHDKPCSGSSNEIVLIARTGNWLHRRGIEQAVSDEAFVNMNTDHLAESYKAWRRSIVQVC